MKERKTRKYLIILLGIVMILIGTGSYFYIKKMPKVTLTEEVDMPIPGKPGRGKAMEDLVPMYAEEYVDDPVLKQAVTYFRRWEWTQLYRELDEIVTEDPDYLDAYRLQAEAYMINKDYEAALSQLDRILERDRTDVHALGVTTVLMHILENEEGEKERLLALEKVSGQAADAVRNVLEETDELLKQPYGSEPQTDMIPQAIAVFGQTPKENGKPSAGLLSRLECALELAERFPDAKIILSGGDVKTKFTEASVMKEWLLEQGVAEDRILLDEKARDTYGNAIGILPICKEIKVHKVMVVGTILHLPRAVTTLTLYAKAEGYDMKIDSAGGGEHEASDEGERLYTYVNASRAAGIFSKQDYEKFQ